MLYLVEFFLAEPLVFSGEVFIVYSKMMLEVVPGPGDDSPARHHRKLWGGGGRLVLEAGGGPGGRGGYRGPGHGLSCLRGLTTMMEHRSPGLRLRRPGLILARTEKRREVKLDLD